MADAQPRLSSSSDGRAEAAPRVTQLAIPGFALDRVRVTRRSRLHTGARQSGERSQQPLIQTYLRRLASHGAAPNSVDAYCYQLRSLLRAAERWSGSAIELGELFRNVSVLGRALVDDRGGAEGERLSKWTLAQRRSAARSFASLMRPELVALLGEDPHTVLDRALRCVADRVGGGYRLTGGVPRGRGGRAPSADEVAAVIAEAGAAAGFAGARNRAFFGILAATGTRVNALRELDGAAYVELPTGKVRLFLPEKGKAERREVELGRTHADALREYAGAFNQHASRLGWRVRVQLGAPGPIWRNSGCGRWPYRDILATLRAACGAAGVLPFAPHALRRAFATDAASVLPRHIVAMAGGWQGLERLDDHYVRPRPQVIWEKLRPEGVAKDEETAGHVIDEATAALSRRFWVRRETSAPRS